MLKHGLLISLLIYLISCTSSDNGLANETVPAPLKVSIGAIEEQAEKAKAFSAVLEGVSRRQMIHASETDLQNSIKAYLPDSTVSEGYDLHFREIGQIDSFRLVFHEYFDLYDDWSKTYLDIFSPSGSIMDSKRMWNLSFEGSIDIHFVNNKIVEIAYHDFFKLANLKHRALIPDQFFYLNSSSKAKDIVQGTIYEYYEINKQGTLKGLSQKTQVSPGRYFPQSSVKLLSLEELKQYALPEIKLMKEEMLAEHGYVFTDASTQEYFETQNWYFPKSANIDLLLSDVEKLNFELLNKIQKEY